MKGRIIKIISNQYTVLDDDYKQYKCICMGKIRKTHKPKVGDLVEFEKYDDKYGIEKIMERKNELVRPPVANVDQAIIVMSCREPDFSPVLVDRLVFLAQYANIEPVICITKMDLTTIDDPIFQYIEDYRKGGYLVLTNSKVNLDPELFNIIKRKVNVLMGQSGVGKSSMMNLIDPDFKLATQEISKALNRGKHTTRHSQLYLVHGGLLADTPGFSALEYQSLEPHILKDVIKDFKPYLGMCKFNDCLHMNEPKCAVKDAVENNEVSRNRYNNYVDMVQTIIQGGKIL